MTASSRRWPAFALALLSWPLCWAGAPAANKLTAITTHEQFSQFSQGYYRDPRPDLVDSAMRYATTKGLWAREASQAPLLASFSCIFARHQERREAWKKSIAALAEAPRKYFQRAMDTPPMQLLAEAAVSPEKNDMQWGCFFATGDERYLREVIATMGFLGERKDMRKYLAGASAQWSLADIAKRDAKVKAALQGAAAGQDVKLAAAARDALDKPVADIRASAEQVLRQQRDAGVW
jgi:hypothetical protein